MNYERTRQKEQQATDYRNSGQVERAVKEYRELAAAFTEDGQAERAAEMIHMAGVSYKIGNHTEASLREFNTAKQMYESAGSQVGVGRVLRDIGITHAYAGDFDQALPLLEASVKELKVTDAKDELGISQVKLGDVLSKCGETEKAEALIRQGIDTLSQGKHWFYKMTAHMHLAHILYVRQDYTAALDTVNQVLEELEAHADERHDRRRAQAHTLKSYTLKKLGEDTLAEREAVEAARWLSSLDEASQGYLKDQASKGEI